MKIGLLSDTHGIIDDAIFQYFKDCDEIWHAGDIGTPEVLDRLKSFKPVRAVYGNIDGHEIRQEVEEVNFFLIEGLKILMTHIGGHPPHYNASTLTLLTELQPDVFICGHSHILRISRDQMKNNLLYLNPGACGNHGFHKVRTLIRFSVDSGKIKNPEVIELYPRMISTKKIK